MLYSHKSIDNIWLGLESNVKIQRVRADDVVIDKNIDKTDKKDKNILYAAGWSIEQLIETLDYGLLGRSVS